jgi:hypothetical protein
MSRRTLLLPGLSLTLAVLLAGAMALPEDDEDESEGVRIEVPASVLKAAAAAVDGIEVEEASIEAVLIYELSGAAGGKTHEVEVTAEGKVLSVEEENEADDDKDAQPAARDDDDDGDEKENADADGDDKDGEERKEAADNEEDEGDAEHELTFPVSAVPAAVREAAVKAVAGIELAEAEVESVLVYELEGEAGEKEYELEVTADGRVLEVEEREDEE